MQILLAGTVMVAAGASLLIAFSLRIWSRAYQTRFDRLREQIEESIVATEGKISDIQAALGDLRYKVDIQGEKGSSQRDDDF